MFLCKLVDGDLVLEMFYREGKSQEKVKEGLEMFQWPKGEWTIEEV